MATYVGVEHILMYGSSVISGTSSKLNSDQNVARASFRFILLSVPSFSSFALVIVL